MADHNGDYSPEAERARQLKREKMQRRRIRERIREGRATDLEREAMEIWDAGSEAWEEIAQALTDVKERVPAQPAQPRPPRAAKKRKVAQGESKQVAQPEGEQKSDWGAWVAGGSLAAIIAAIFWAGLRGL